MSIPAINPPVINPHYQSMGTPRSPGDCTVIALSLLLNIPYPEALILMTKYGRSVNGKWQQGASKRFRASLSYILKGDIVARRGSVGKFVRTHPRGKFLIWVRRHVFAVQDGVIFDHTNKPGRHIHRAWSVGTRTVPTLTNSGK